ncbi:MAG: phenylacetic acid degradation operon negative regulatory protein PaaX, partial [Casimicrobiaceae bacterium]
MSAPDPRDATGLPDRHPDPAVRIWIARELTRHPPRAKSLVITVWGDAIAPHGGAVMLSGLIALLARLRVSERLVRTSVFRLAKEGWLASTPIGRRSLYRLTREGGRRFEPAYRRIYASVEPTWDEAWELVIADGLSAAQRRSLQAELSWEGFGTMGPGVFGRPARLESAVARIAAALGVDDRIIAVRARDDPRAGCQSLHAAVGKAWDLAAIAAEYRAFLLRFGNVVERLRHDPADARDPGQCFAVRTLLIHAYRRTLLRDPQLPAALLPLDWPGNAAAALCRDVYRVTLAGAERHLATTLEGPNGALPPVDDAFGRRFGGLTA